MRPVKTGKGVRMTFSRQKEVLEMPNLIEIQKNSYQWFLRYEFPQQESLNYFVIQEEHTQFAMAGDHTEIGRASCRERV